MEQEDRTSLKPLMEQAAESLTGEKVVVHLRNPVFSNYVGHAYRAKSGMAMIDISPDLALEEFFSVWLHEVGHVLHGHLSQDEPFDFHEYSSGLVKQEVSAVELSEYRQASTELEADNFAKEIGRYALHLAEQLYADTSVEKRICALSNVTIKKES